MLGILVPRSSPMPYICDDLMESIFLMIDPSRTLDRLNLIKTNRHLYNKYYKEYSNTVAKMKIYKTLNNNYLAFYRFLNTFSYSDEEKSDLLECALRDIPLVQCTWQQMRMDKTVLDLRFIFELMYNEAYVDKKTRSSIKHLHPARRLWGKMVWRINKCISTGNRHKTKKALNREQPLCSLHTRKPSLAVHPWTPSIILKYDKIK